MSHCVLPLLRPCLIQFLDCLTNLLELEAKVGVEEGSMVVPMVIVAVVVGVVCRGGDGGLVAIPRVAGEEQLHLVGDLRLPRVVSHKLFRAASVLPHHTCTSDAIW